MEFRNRILKRNNKKKAQNKIDLSRLSVLKFKHKLENDTHRSGKRSKLEEIGHPLEKFCIQSQRRDRLNSKQQKQQDIPYFMDQCRKLRVQYANEY